MQVKFNEELPGWAGTLILVLAYTFIVINIKIFLILDFTATALLLLYSFLKKDRVFIVVNGWILIVLLIKILNTFKLI